MQTGLVSIRMPAYNAERFIAEAIESALAQTYAHWELLVVNDGSTDQTPGIVAQFTDPRLKLIHKENGGESSARNVALDHSQGEFIAYLDADDAYLPHHLDIAVNYLRTHPERDGVYTDGYYIDQNGKRLKSLTSRRRGPFEGRLFEEAVRASDVFGPPLSVVLLPEPVPLTLMTSIPPSPLTTRISVTSLIVTVSAPPPVFSVVSSAKPLVASPCVLLIVKVFPP